MLLIRRYLLLVCFVVSLFSCGTKETKSLSTGQPQKQIKIILESLHDPIENAGVLVYRTEIAEHSFVKKSVFNQEGNLLSEEQFDPKANMTQRVMNHYDEKGNLTETVTYKLKSVSGKRVNKYNPLNKLIESNEFDAAGKNTRRQTVRYDSDGNRTVVVLVWFNGAFIKTAESFYNEHEQNIQNNHFTMEMLNRKETNRFDYEGNRVETIQYYPSGMEEKIIHFKYDSLHNVTEMVVLNSSLLIESRINYTYDERNNMTQLFRYGIKGNLKEYIRHSYVYDEAGNWTRDNTFMNKRPTSVRIRNIEYY